MSYVYEATVVRVVDGDTVDLDVDLGFHVRVRERFRLNGIDTPERGQDGFEEATNRLKELLGDECVVESHKTGKFGRWLGILRTPDGVNVNDVLLSEGLAKPYGK